MRFALPPALWHYIPRFIESKDWFFIICPLQGKALLTMKKKDACGQIYPGKWQKSHWPKLNHINPSLPNQVGVGFRTDDNPYFALLYKMFGWIYFKFNRAIG
jgi:hypothetical protein